MAVFCEMPDDYDVRVFPNGQSQTGRLEMYHRSRWGTVCDDVTPPARHVAMAACNQLGLHGRSTFGCLTGECNRVIPGNVAVLYGNMSCTGRESALRECSYISGLERTSCPSDNSRDLMIQCEPKLNGTIRLIPVYSNSSGRIEMLLDNRWTTVCDDFEDSDKILATARVTCRQLGYQTGRFYGCFTGECNKVAPGSGPIYAARFACSGTETDVRDCPYADPSPHCTHLRDLMIECGNFVDYSLRIVSDANGNRPILILYII